MGHGQSGWGQEHYDELVDVRNDEQLLNMLLRFGRSCGMSKGSVVVTSIAEDGSRGAYSIDCYSEAYTREVYAHAECMAHDPVMGRIRARGLPVWWNAGDYERAGRERQWDSMWRHGLREGVAACLDVPGGLRVYAGIETDDAGLYGRGDQQRITADLVLWLHFAAHPAVELARQGLMRTASVDRHRLAGGIEVREMPLTPRLLEVLRWAAEGKTDREIGEILGLTRSTVSTYLQQVYSRLEVDGRAAATKRAMDLRLFDRRAVTQLRSPQR